MDDRRHLVVEVTVAGDEVDLLSGALWAAGATGIEERAADAGVRLFVSFMAASAEAIESLVSRSNHRYEVRAVAADEGVDEWRRWARTQRVGRRIVVQPTWIGTTYDVADDDLVLRIDPGPCFGSGTHATTRLALTVLEEVVHDDTTVLDVGSGSGVLAVAAARLGAPHVVALDIDVSARAVARENITVNGVSDVAVVADESLDQLDGPFDIVVANIDAGTLASMAASLTNLVAAGGALVTSGVLVDQQVVLAAALCRTAAISAVDERGEGDWVAALWRSERAATPFVS